MVTFHVNIIVVVDKIKDLKCTHVFQLQAYDPDIQDRTAEQHIEYFVVKDDQQLLLQIAKNGCLSQIKVSGIYRYSQYKKVRQNSVNLTQ
jgi:hypothetical protein